MSTSYSTSLKLSLMANGEDSNTWGSITNTNWQMIEQSVSGVVSVTMANANYTLSNLNGTLSEAHAMVLNIGGTNSGIYQVIAPLVSKFYVVSNNTSGGYAITIGGASGSIVSIPNGYTAQVFCDGANFFAAQTTSTGNFNINGNSTVGGNQTINGNETIAGTLGVTGNTTLVNATVSGTLGVTGAATFSSTVTISGNNVDSFPSGTRLVFNQGTAPAGWTQDTSDTANNRMLRVVNSTGGGTGGSSDPTLMNVVPYHTHGFSGSTAGATTGTYIGDPGHAHGVYDPGHAHTDNGVQVGASPPGGANPFQSFNGTHSTYAAGTGIGIYGNTTGVYINDPGHAHSFSGGTDGGSSQTNWTPRYVNMIICQKN